MRSSFTKGVLAVLLVCTVYLTALGSATVGAVLTPPPEVTAFIQTENPIQMFITSETITPPSPEVLTPVPTAVPTPVSTAEPTLAPSPTLSPTEAPTEPPVPQDKGSVDPSGLTYSYTEDELQVFANLLYYECRGQSYSVKLKCASVVLNRVFYESEFPDDICGVIFQNKPARQFTPSTRNLRLYNEWSNGYMSECYQAAREVMENGSVLPPLVMVFNDLSSGGWPASRERYCTEGGMLFAYLWRKK